MSVLDLRIGNLTFVPVVPGRMEFAVEVRRRALALQPQAIAVELPENLEKEYLKSIDRFPQISAIMLEGDDDADVTTYLLVEPADPMTEAVRSARELDASVHFIEPPSVHRPDFRYLVPDTYAVTKLGYEAYVSAFLKQDREYDLFQRRHIQAIAHRLQGLDPIARTLVICSLEIAPLLMELVREPQEDPQLETSFVVRATVVNPSPDSLVDVLQEYPYLQERYEQYRMLMDPELSDRLSIQNALLKEAELAYHVNTGDSVQPYQRRLIARYARNLAYVGGQLLPSLFDLVVAARSIVDDNYGWEVHHLAGKYPAQQKTSFPETVDLSAEEVFLDTKKIRIRRRLPRVKGQTRPANLQQRKLEKRRGEWAEELNGQGICSYPPEDLVIEDYGRFLKKQASQVLSAERQQVEEFTTSLLDGIDVRETMRNWHQGRIFVHRLERGAVDVGSVVVIFDDKDDDRYYYTTTWLGEHQNESDMAFFATHPFDHMVGPGIGRAEYGGFLMTLPSHRLYDVWSDPDYESAENKAERLLLAGIDYSLERNIVYVAPRPPRSVFRTLAARVGKRIIYVPLGQLSSDKLKKVRVVHVLNGHDKRDIAKDYIW